MKLSADTIAVLKSFASINNSLVFKEGSELSTVTAQKTIIAKVKIPDSFERKFAIYDLSQFLSVLSLFDAPELEFNETYLTISSGQEQTTYRYADESLIVTPPSKELNFPTPDVSITLTSENLGKVLKAGSALGLTEIAVAGQDGKISIRALDAKQPDANHYKIDVGDTDLTFRAVFKIDNIKLLPDDYKVEISSKGISRFTSDRATYFVAIEKTSTF